MLIMSFSFPPRLLLSFRLNFSTTYVRLTAAVVWYARRGRQKVSHLIRHDKNVNDIPDARYFDTVDRVLSMRPHVLARTPIYVWCVMRHYYLLAIMQSNRVAGRQISRSSDGDSAIDHDIRLNDAREEKGRMESAAHIVAPVCRLLRVRNPQILIDTREIRRAECCTSACPGSCFLRPKDTRNLPGFARSGNR